MVEGRSPGEMRVPEDTSPGSSPAERALNERSFAQYVAELAAENSPIVFRFALPQSAQGVRKRSGLISKVPEALDFPPMSFKQTKRIDFVRKRQ